MTKNQYRKFKLRIKLLTSKLDKMIAKCKEDTENMKKIFKLIE